MTTIVHLTRAELRKLVASRTYLIGLTLSVGVSVISVAVDAAVAGKNSTAGLGTAASTNQMLKLGSVLRGRAGAGHHRLRQRVPAQDHHPRRAGCPPAWRPGGREGHRHRRGGRGAVTC